MTATNTIDPKEAAHFGAMAADWWNPKGSSAMLHQLNPVRLAYIRDRIDQHWGLDECDLKPLKGRSAADVGCGAGLLAAPRGRLARRGARGAAARRGRRAPAAGAGGAALPPEPLARLGAEVTGVDPAPENIAAAQSHAL